MNAVWIPLVAMALSALLTGVIRHYALAASLMDQPNERSAHTLPTPRGGGLAIALSYLLCLPLLSINGMLSTTLLWALLGAGSGLALLGLMDDRGHIPARWRLLGQTLAAIWVLYWLGGLPPITFFGWPMDLGGIGHGLALLWLVWLINLYNFMDGLDGLASLEAISITLGAALIYSLSGPAPELWPCLLLAAAVLGFLVWNFPPARIFMGDAGSNFLGIALGSLMLEAAHREPSLWWSWLILLGVFVVDTTLTLIRRLLRGEKVYLAHRRHAYQYAARQYNSHRTVTLGATAINLCWLLPIALWVSLGGLEGLLGLLLAYIPLVWLAVHFRAGQPEATATDRPH